MASETEDTGGGSSDLLGGADLSGGADAGGQDGGSANGGDDKGGEKGSEPEFLTMLSAEGGDADNPSNRDYAKGKGFKTLDDVLKSYREAEKTVRASGKIALPGTDAKPEDIAAFRTAIGVPDKAEGYEITGPEGIALDTDMIGKLSASAVAHGTPKAAFQGIVSDFIKIQLDQAAAIEVQQKAESTEWLKAQGAGSTEKLAQVDKAASALGFTKTDMAGFKSALGPKRTLDILAKLGEGMSEDVLTNGGKGKFGITGAEAIAELGRLKLDKDFQTKVMVKGSAERARYDRLNQAAAEHQARANTQ